MATSPRWSSSLGGGVVTLTPAASAAASTHEGVTNVALTPHDVSRLADLARIELTDDELAELAPQLDVILNAVAGVAEVADEDIPPTSHAVPITNAFRSDAMKLSWPAGEMLRSAPAEQDQRFRVPRILDDSDEQ